MALTKWCPSSLLEQCHKWPATHLNKTRWFLTQYQKDSDFSWSYLSYEVSGKSELEWGKTISTYQQPDDTDLSDKGFKGTITKMFHWAVMNLLETNEKNTISQCEKLGQLSR